MKIRDIFDRVTSEILEKQIPYFSVIDSRLKEQSFVFELSLLTFKTVDPDLIAYTKISLIDNAKHFRTYMRCMLVI